MKLYECNFAPSPRRVRIFLAEKGLKIPMVEIDLLAGENIQPAYLAINPRGLVPTLELDDGTRIDECVTICRYIEDLHPEPNLMGIDAKSRALIAARDRFVELDGFIRVSEVFRNTAEGFSSRGLQGVPDAVPAIAELAERGRAGIRRFYASLEKYLGENRYVAGDRFTMADITALTTIDFAAWVKQGVPEDSVHVKRWHDEVSKRPSAAA